MGHMRDEMSDLRLEEMDTKTYTPTSANTSN